MTSGNSFDCLQQDLKCSSPKTWNKYTYIYKDLLKIEKMLGIWQEAQTVTI